MWLYCAGSLLLNIVKDDDAGYDAAQGTVAHHVGETWLIDGERPEYLVGEIMTVEGFDITITNEMLNYVEEYVVWCRELPGTHFIEKRVTFSEYTPIDNQGGTADFFSIDGTTVYIVDLKYGMEQVFAYKNTQAMLYALGVVLWLLKRGKKIEKIFIRICQPRLEHFDEWETSFEEIMQFAEFVRERAALAWTENAPLTPGEKQCRWCKVADTCAARLVRLAELTEGEFDNLDAPVTDFEMELAANNLSTIVTRDLPSARELNTEQLATLYSWRRTIELFFKGIEDELERRMQDGEAVSPYKMVLGRSSRVFKYDEPEKLIEDLDFRFGLTEDQVRPRDTISVAQLEILLKNLGYKKAFVDRMLAPIVRKIPGKPTMAPVYDRRPEILLVPNDGFDNLDDDEL